MHREGPLGQKTTTLATAKGNTADSREGEDDGRAATGSPRERYERAIERLKQAARRYHLARQRRAPALTQVEYRAEVEAARREYEAVLREVD
jgi:hypothetical protein